MLVTPWNTCTLLTRSTEHQLTNHISGPGVPKNITLSSEDEHVLLPFLHKNKLDVNAHGMATLSVMQDTVAGATKRNDYTERPPDILWQSLHVPILPSRLA